MKNIIENGAAWWRKWCWCGGDVVVWCMFLLESYSWLHDPEFSCHLRSSPSSSSLISHIQIQLLYFHTILPQHPHLSLIHISESLPFQPWSCVRPDHLSRSSLLPVTLFLFTSASRIFALITSLSFMLVFTPCHLVVLIFPQHPYSSLLKSLLAASRAYFSPPLLLSS